MWQKYEEKNSDSENNNLQGKGNGNVLNLVIATDLSFK